MRTEWPTEEADLLMAEDIINKHLTINEGKALGLIEFYVDSNAKLAYRTSDWVLELADYFDVQYGAEMGSIVTNKVLTRCLIKDATQH